MAAWSFLQHEKASFLGNLGYADDLSRIYAWDSEVPRSGDPMSQDFALIRDTRAVFGIARISSIDENPGAEKVRRKCPSCRKTRFNRRSTMTPAYRCSECGTAFDEPDEEVVAVTAYIANYEGAWWPFDSAVA